MSAPNNALVGPLPTVSFWGGIPYGSTPPRIAYRVPRNTLDIRYAACRDHHVACDCREAEFAEQISEYCSEMRAAERAFADVLAGHQTWAYDSEGERDTFAECKCTGCEIARRTHFRPSYHVSQERRDAKRKRAGEVPF